MVIQAGAQQQLLRYFDAFIASELCFQMHLLPVRNTSPQATPIGRANERRRSAAFPEMFVRRPKTAESGNLNRSCFPIEASNFEKPGWGKDGIGSCELPLTIWAERRWQTSPRQASREANCFMGQK